MEAGPFLAHCNRGNVEGAVVCVSLVNRLERDNVIPVMDQVGQLQENLVNLIVEVSHYIYIITYIYYS